MALPLVLHVVALGVGPTETFVERQLVGDRFDSELVRWGAAPGRVAAPVFEHVITSRARRPALARWERHGRVFGLLARMRPALVHAHFGNVGRSVAPHCRALRLPLIVSFYGHDLGVGSHEALRARYRTLFGWASAIFVEGPAARARVIALGAPKARVQIVALALPAWADDPPRRELDFAEGSLRVLQVARFVEKKGVERSLRAVAWARAQGAKVELDLVGDGPLDAELRGLARKLELDAEVRFRGALPASDLPSLYAGRHLLLQPSQTASDGDTEGGHPTVLIEAQAAGLPVLATTHADIPFAVADGESGVLVDEAAPPEVLGEVLCRLDRDRAWLQRLASQARRRVMSRHAASIVRLERELHYARVARRVGGS